jgi:Zn-dependent peptidase ImmA (M78 family)
MNYPKVNIDLSRYKWAIEKSDVDEETIFSKFPKLNEWISGNDQPTMRELSDFSLFTHIPIGFFFLYTPPTESFELLKSRTLQGHPNYHPSRNFLDTIHHMTNLQDWMRNYYITYVGIKNDFVGSLKNARTIENMANEIRKKLNIENNWFTKISGNDSHNNFNFIRSRIQSLDIIVMMNGVVGLNSKRSLNVKEIRAFTLIDDYIPLIFINGKDFPAGRIFSLIHELIHVSIGVNNIYNDDNNNTIKSDNAIEKICNAVTAEILVPIELFKSLWLENNDKEHLIIISDLAKYFKVSELVIARRAVDQQYISKSDYNKINNKIQSGVNKLKTNNTSPGGNAINTFFSRFDNNYLKIIKQCLDTGYLLYTDAYRLTGLSRLFFDKIIDLVEYRT